MNEFTLSELQEKIAELYKERDYHASPQTLLLGAMEELGETSQALLITATTDFIPSAKKLSPEWACVRDIASEVGDTITYLLAMCNALKIEPTFKWMRD